jgi:PKD repeat protein
MRIMRSLSRSLGEAQVGAGAVRWTSGAGPLGVMLILLGLTPSPAVGAASVPVLWTAGGLSAGTDSAGQAARIATDAWGNVAVVSGPALARDLAVTSYTASGSFRWRSAVSPSVGTFTGDWVVAAPNGDIVAVGRNVDSRGNPIAITLVRYGSDGTLQWRIDLARTRPWVARLMADGQGNAYLAFSSVGDGQDIQLLKYNASGALLWSQVVSTGSFANDMATSLALSPDDIDVVVTGNISGGASWITAAYNATTGVRKWLVAAAEGTAARDVVVDARRVYVTGQGNVGTSGLLTVVAYDRATGARLWRTDRKPADAAFAAGLRMDLAPDGSLVVAGQASRGFLDWYTVAFETTGQVRWEAIRDGGLNTDEVPQGVLVLPDGTSVVTGPGGPNLPGGFIQGVTAGYAPNGTLLWEAFSRMATVWAVGLPSGDVCATGGYDALVTCWRVAGAPTNRPPTAVMTATPSTGVAPLSVTFDGSTSTDPDGSVASWSWSFGDGALGTGPATTHLYMTAGTFAVSLTVTDNGGASAIATRSVVVTAAPAPAAPKSLMAVALTSSSIGLKWANGTTPQSLVKVERCTGFGCTKFVQVAALPGTATTFADNGLVRKTAYTYRVRASNAAGDSPYSNTASARTQR